MQVERWIKEYSWQYANGLVYIIIHITSHEAQYAVPLMGSEYDTDLNNQNEFRNTTRLTMKVKPTNKNRGTTT